MANIHNTLYSKYKWTGIQWRKESNVRIFAFFATSNGRGGTRCVKEVLESGWITTGPKNQALDKPFAS